MSARSTSSPRSGAARHPKWKQAVNAALRPTGYRLTRIPPAVTPAASSGAAAAPAKPPKPTAPLPDKGPSFPHDFDEGVRSIITTVRPRTMTSNEKLWSLVSTVRYVVRHEIPGAIVECGVWRGGSMQAAALTLLEQGVSDRDLYLYDTYEGMTPAGDEDRRRDGRSAAELLAAYDKTNPIWAAATYEDVEQGMRDTGYPMDRVTMVKGPVEETVPGPDPSALPDQISVLRLDTDWYASTRHELEHLYPRLVSGGVLLLDDYGYWDGARKAVDEWLEQTGERLLLLRMSEGRIAVKP